MRMCLAIIGLGLLVGCSGPAVWLADRWVARNGGVCAPTDAERLASLSGRFDAVLCKPIKLIVLDRADLRAYSFPSGEVIVTRGLVANLSDDELTAVIGHEVGHLLRGGHRKAPVALTGQSRAADTESAADDASVITMTSRWATWESSWASTPSSSSTVSRSRMPVVTQTAEWLGERPVANALGRSV